MICPLHGPIWREDLGWLLDKYQKWSSYTPEENTVAIFYGSMYGNTAEAADLLAGKLAFDPDTQCSHHHGEDHNCGNHTCGEDKHGCAGNH